MKQKLSLFIVFILTLMYNRSVARDFPPFNDSSIYFSSQLSPSQIYFIPARHSFSKQPHRSFDFGITGNEYCYVILKIQSERVDSSYVLSIDNTSLDTVLIYRLSEEGQLNLIYSGGNLIPYISNRQYVWHIVRLH
ncbi:MAG TPA: 7TM-DISM domain-containing protein, partial [Flavisolibacter sp.]|nr:7TM-DISM domain-containing protein [Flavisolibacter sp.]